MSASSWQINRTANAAARDATKIYGQLTHSGELIGAGISALAEKHHFLCGDIRQVMPRIFQISPSWYMCARERFEHLRVIPETLMKQVMDGDEVLESLDPIE
ncbi:hypothetical protein DIE15_15340 [Burkholderia sp. Bp9031]|nr:hypothetical protein DIE15_15340 [Burkholderia sp. Bp9031]